MIARKSPSTGVGRGNGPGSRKGQFKDGMPSANPHGRPKKEKPPVPRSMEEALRMGLQAMIKGDRAGVPFEMPQYQLMVEILLARYPHATVGEQLRIMGFVQAALQQIGETRPPDPDPQTIEEVVAQLAAEHTRRMALNVELGHPNTNVPPFGANDGSSGARSVTASGKWVSVSDKRYSKQQD